MTRAYPPVEHRPGEWSEPLYPVEGFRMACCDCSLVHEMEFRAVRIGPVDAKGGFVVLEEIDGARVQMRLRRNGRSTAALRRNRKGTKA